MQSTDACGIISLDLEVTRSSVTASLVILILISEQGSAIECTHKKKAWDAMHCVSDAKQT
jgi:hypothetical protein